ncbi:MAG TPA: DUF302 domain-containing protein [Patescibacteria group bacterium]|nr:DUF302 domain-containing protein [Patescibacteria group bacterium]
MNYGYRKEVNMPFEKAVEKTKAELAKEGFGILTEINVKATIKKKLDVDYENYVILGACNPPFAYQALEAEKEIGLLLPCNVIVFEEGGKVYISAVLPTVAMNVSENKTLAKIAQEVEEKLKRTVDGI